MKLFVLSLLLSGLVAATAIPEFATESAELEAQNCNCNHNDDAGRWDDDLKPSDRLDYLCKTGGGCWGARIGKMCVAGNDGNNCDCAVQAARNWESWHGNWFLWSAVTCGNVAVTITSN